MMVMSRTMYALSILVMSMVIYACGNTANENRETPVVKEKYGSVERGVIRGNGARNRGDIDNHPPMQQTYRMGLDV